MSAVPAAATVVPVLTVAAAVVPMTMAIDRKNSANTFICLGRIVELLVAEAAVVVGLVVEAPVIR